MKKNLIKYSLDFVVIVLGISVSFWVNERQNDKENKIKEIAVYENIKTELNDLTEMINERKNKFNYDLEIVNNLYDESSNLKYNYTELMVAITAYRVFNPNIEIYSSLKYDGSLKYISNSEIKVAINRFYSSNLLYANMEEEIIVEREILNYLHVNYPLVLLNTDSKKLDDTNKINYFHNIIYNDLTFRSLLKSKQRFMMMKLQGIEKYKLQQEKLMNLIDNALSHLS